MTPTRGDVIIASVRGRHGKPRAWVVYNANAVKVTACPCTSRIEPSPYRSTLEHSDSNGLKHTSSVMADNITTFPAEWIGRKIGNLTSNELEAINSALRSWLGFHEFS